MKLKHIFIILLMAGAGLLGTSCASFKKTEQKEPLEKPAHPREAEKAEMAKPQKKPGPSGIKGTVVPVNRDGEVISMQERNTIIITCIPIKKGEQLPEQKVVVHPERNGNFKVILESGDYMVEFFLRGFYIKNIDISVPEGKIVNIGDISLERIEAGAGLPLQQEEEPEEMFKSGGDVNIQPPAS